MKERRLTRREFLRRSAIVVAGAGLVVGGGYLLERFGRSPEENRLPIATPTPESRHRLIEIQKGSYFEELKQVIEQVQQRDDLKDLRDVYLGNVNDFDRGGVIISQAAMETTTGGKTFGFEISIDPETGKHKAKQFNEVRPEQEQVKISIPEHILRTVREKQDKIKMFYLDTRQNHPFKKDFKNAGYVIEDSIQRLLAAVDIEIDQEIIKWNPETEIFWGSIVIPEIDRPDIIINNRLVLSGEHKHILIADRPLKILLLDKVDRRGFVPHLYSNLAVVRLDQDPSGSKEDIIETTLQETAHMYGMPHCWESECAMSYKQKKMATRSIGTRCSMIGKNIGAGEIVVVKDPENARAYFKSAKLIPEDEARRDLEEHLLGYLDDISTLRRPEGVELETILGRKLDVVRFYQDGGIRMELSIPDYIGSVDVK